MFTQIFLLSYFRKYLANLPFNNQVSLLILWDAGLVNDDQVLPLEILDQTGCWIDNKRGPSDDEEVSLLDGSGCLAKDVHIEGFLVKGHIRLDHLATVEAMRNSPCQS